MPRLRVKCQERSLYHDRILREEFLLTSFGAKIKPAKNVMIAYSGRDPSNAVSPSVNPRRPYTYEIVALTMALNGQIAHEYGSE
jgi:hypothetical protein